MEGKVKIIDEKDQRIRVVFEPMSESIMFYGEARIKNNEWTVFSTFKHEMVIDLNQIQEKMANVVTLMRKRLKEYNNVNEGFGVIKEVEFRNTED